MIGQFIIKYRGAVFCSVIEILFFYPQSRAGPGTYVFQNKMYENLKGNQLL